MGLVFFCTMWHKEKHFKPHVPGKVPYHLESEVKLTLHFEEITAQRMIARKCHLNSSRKQEALCCCLTNFFSITIIPFPLFPSTHKCLRRSCEYHCVYAYKSMTLHVSPRFLLTLNLCLGLCTMSIQYTLHISLSFRAA